MYPPKHFPNFAKIITISSPTYHIMIKQIKHQFMAFRNGIVADALRKTGHPHKIIFGLQLPDISRIARNITDSELMRPSEIKTLADELWEDSEVRESRLLACHLYNPDFTDVEKALSLAASVRTVEEADILSFRLLRKLSFARSLLDTISKESRKGLQVNAGGFTPLKAVAIALARNLENS